MRDPEAKTSRELAHELDRPSFFQEHLWSISASATPPSNIFKPTWCTNRGDQTGLFPGIREGVYLFELYTLNWDQNDTPPRERPAPLGHRHEPGFLTRARGHETGWFGVLQQDPVEDPKSEGLKKGMPLVPVTPGRPSVFFCRSTGRIKLLSRISGA